MKDHREIGQSLDLFMFSDLSPGCPIWLPNGNIVYSLLSNKIRDLNLNNGYVEVRTPIIYKSKLFKISGHWEHYKENMYQLQGEEEYALKPMNCPIHMEIYKSKLRSYRDLPYRIHDQGVLHRKEISGAIGGLTRCKSFCQDDAHCFVTPETLQAEILSLIDMVKRVYKAFDMQIRAVLSCRPDDYMGDLKDWNHAEAELHQALGHAWFNDVGSRLDFTVEYGQGAFYGPKIDFLVKDSMDREWQTATIQLDFQLPKNFKLQYVGADNQPHTPIVIHRAFFGSFERFIGILLEHYQGKLPVWLAPIQAIILPITDKHVEYAKEVEQNIVGRIKIDNSSNTLAQKVAVAQEQKIPYILVVGNKEMKNGTISVRNRDGEQKEMYWDGFDKKLEVKSRFEF